MRQRFYEHPEVMLTVIAIFFIVLLVSIYSWGIGTVISSINDATNPNGIGRGTISFNIDQAQSLDWRGLVK